MSRLSFIGYVLIIGICATLVACPAVPIFEPQHNNSAAPARIGKQSINQGADSASASTMQDDCSKYFDSNKRFLLKTETDAKITRVKVGATGYGAPPKRYYPDGQARIMTMRASKMDAYRALAEVVGGLHIWGGSSIGDMVLEHDRYKAFIDTYVRGAHVISVNALEDGTYKTVVEMEVDQHMLSQVMAFVDPAAKACLEAQGVDLDKVYYSYSKTQPNFYYSE